MPSSNSFSGRCDRGVCHDGIHANEDGGNERHGDDPRDAALLSHAATERLVC